MLQVFGFPVGDHLGEAVGCHQDGDIIALCWSYGVQSLGYAKGEGINEGWKGVPCPGYAHCQTWGDGLLRFIQGAVVATHNVGGVLRGEDDSDDLSNAFAGELSQTIFYGWWSVTHADADFGGLMLRLQEALQA